MKTQEIFVENIKCGGCMTSIKLALEKIKGIAKVEIDKEEEKISLTGDHYKRSNRFLEFNGLSTAR